MTCTLVPSPERTDDERIDINELLRADIETIDWDRVMIEAGRSFTSACAQSSSSPRSCRVKRRATERRSSESRIVSDSEQRSPAACVIFAAGH
jgi:hypothetical protein